MKPQKINWAQGSGSMIIIALITMMTIYLLLLYMTITNIFYAKTVATSRTDLIADSVAVYAQSYDYSFNKSRAEEMRGVLTDYNNTTTDAFTISTTLDFPEPISSNDSIIDRLKISSIVQTVFWYGNTNNYIYTTAESIVDSIDIWKDILVVPDNIGNNEHKPTEDPITPSDEQEDILVVPDKTTQSDDTKVGE